MSAEPPVGDGAGADDTAPAPDGAERDAPAPDGAERDAAPAPDAAGRGAAHAGERLVIRKRGRRVTTEPPAGYTGEPAVDRQQSSENDARLKGDKPPHWG